MCSGPRAKPAQLYTHMSINNIPDCDEHVHHENRSLIQSLTLMRSATIHIRTGSDDNRLGSIFFFF